MTLPISSRSSNNSSSGSTYSKRHMSSSAVAPHPSYAPPIITSPPSRSMSFLSSIKEGFGLGVGSSIGDRLVQSVFGPRTIQVQTVSTNCDKIISQYNQGSVHLEQEYQECMKKSN
jgi:hypothetical protein